MDLIYNKLERLLPVFRKIISYWRCDIILYKTHIAGGLALGYILFNKIPMLNVDIRESKSLIIITSGLILGSLFPDIDHRNSYLSRKIKPISFITSKLFKHREFTHSIVGTITVSYLLYLILDRTNIETMYSSMFNEAFTIGIISHIILDMMTVSGVVLFYPIYKKRIGIGMFSTKSWKIESKEKFIMTIFIILTLISYFGSF